MGRTRKEKKGGTDKREIEKKIKKKEKTGKERKQKKRKGKLGKDM